MDRYTATFAQVSLTATLVSAVVMMLVGALWYSSMLFGRAWMQLSGIRASDIRPAEAARGYIFAALFALLTAYLLGVVAAHTSTHPMALFSSVIAIWLFILAELANGFMWEKQPFALFLLQAFRSLFSLLAGAAVFFFWG